MSAFCSGLKVSLLQVDKEKRLMRISFETLHEYLKVSAPLHFYSSLVPCLFAPFSVSSGWHELTHV